MTNSPYARDMLTALITRPYESRDPYRPTDIYDRRDETLRDMLCTDSDDAIPLYADYALMLDADAIPQHEYDYMRQMLQTIRDAANEPYDETNRQFLSMLALDHSLCPMHNTDYAICFDDNDPECSQIRAFFPCHDT